jgi:hypothetical protein
MSFLRHGQIYQSDVFGSEWQSEADYRFALPLIVLMSLRPAIPRRVALLHCSLPLHRTIPMVNGVAGTVNHHSAGAGEFSVGDLGNFQLALTETQIEIGIQFVVLADGIDICRLLAPQQGS